MHMYDLVHLYYVPIPVDLGSRTVLRRMNQLLNSWDCLYIGFWLESMVSHQIVCTYTKSYINYLIIHTNFKLENSALAYPYFARYFLMGVAVCLTLLKI